MVQPPLDELAAEVAAFAASLVDLEDIRRRLQALDVALTPINESWSNSWVGYESELYYKDFEKPPPNEMFDSLWGGSRSTNLWRPRSFGEVSERVTSTRPGLGLNEIVELLNARATTADKLRSKLLAEVSPRVDQPGYEREAELLKRLEDQGWGTTAEQLLQTWRPAQAASHDMVAIQQGIKSPPHLVYLGRVRSYQSRTGALESFVQTSERLIRQLQVKASTSEQMSRPRAGIEEVLRLCDAFHVVARQLRSRHLDRPTLSIEDEYDEDEYDVQDLLHALLRIFFADVRPEEWTPSYAGQSSRMDFLLKAERLVIEVKKTRESLSAAEIGNQLILDVARYGNHPDCDTLVCLVYDPEGRIPNPKGLEHDLEQMSTDALTVIVAVRPSLN